MKACLFCRKEFEPKIERGKFCSPKCRVYYGRKHGKKEKQASKLDLILSEMAELKRQIQFAPTVRSSFDGEKSSKYKLDESAFIEKNEAIKTHNEYLALIMNAPSIDKCKSLSAEVASASHLAEWQKSVLIKACQERSRHSDLN